MAKGEGGKKLVVVESPTKAKTIRKFLGKDYVVESCMGHIRDLPQSAKDIPEKFKKEHWANLGVDVDHDFQPVYCVPRTKTRIVKTLKEKLAEADELILATDEDREGESISWHLVEVLRPKVPVKRMVFHEITKEAIEGALHKFREIDENLVRAQEARRVLDRLVGYTLSPLLWKKVAYGLSAGRVQSVAVRLIAEREHERIRFKKTKYWAVAGQNSKEQVDFESRLHSFDGLRIATGRDFDGETGAVLADKKGQVRHLLQADAEKIVSAVKGQAWTVDEVEEKPISRKPYPPFITSTLQQESNRKLGMSSRETMEMAQKLYERGFITYMRTDSPFLSQQAVQAARESIKDMYGANYLPAEAREYSAKKSKGAQEAHEAIRPAGTSFIRPEDSGLSGALLKVYELIWKRTIASQMVNAQQKQVSVKFKVGQAVFAASGLTIEFPGFLKVYTEEVDDDAKDSGQEPREVRLPRLKVGDKVDCKGLEITDHETKPPARYTEASLVQTLEREGIGRPSTYATIISTIQDRGYVKKVGNALVPTFTALVVSKLLSKYLPNFVDLKFTSGMEERLDDIANGDLDWVKYLGTIYLGKEGLKSQVTTQEKNIDGEESRSINLAGLNNLSFRIGRYGAYVCREENGEDVCASLPDNQFPGDMTSEIANKLIDQKVSGADALGKDPNTGLPVYVLSGRYGPYVQLGEVDEAPEGKPKRMAIPATIDPAQVTLPLALSLLELPKTLGPHPETGKEIKKGLGRFGPYVVHDGDFRSIPKTDNIFDVDLKRALELFAQPKKMRGRSTPIREMGKHPVSQEEIQVFTGKYGPYIKVGKMNISLPDDVKPEDLTLDLAVKLIAEKAELKAAKGGKSKKAATDKPAKPKAAKAKTPKAAKAPAVAAAAKATETKKVIVKKPASNPQTRG
ncbi:MAG: type I DNA topoisomerase [Bdellovibrionales bacterium]